MINDSTTVTQEAEKEKPSAATFHKYGTVVCTTKAKPNSAKAWVDHIAEITGADLDFHIEGGVGRVLHLGDKESRARVIQEMRKRKNEIDARYIKIENA